MLQCDKMAGSSQRAGRYGHSQADRDCNKTDGTKTHIFCEVIFDVVKQIVLMPYMFLECTNMVRK